MKKLIAMLLAATFAGVSINAIAQEKKAAAKPTEKQCKENPKLEGCPKPAAKK